MDALVDTGASRTIVNGKAVAFFERRGIRIRKMKPYAATIADGNSIWLTSFADVEVRGERRTMRLTIFPVLTVAMLLGVDFLTLFEIELHLSRRRWSFLREPTTLHAFVGEREIVMRQGYAVESAN